MHEASMQQSTPAWLLISGGTFEPLCLEAILAERSFAQVIAIDGGALYCRLAGILPSLVIGDLDTIDAATKAWVLQNEVPLQVLPCQKDMTDTAAAVDYVLQKGGRELHLLAGLGGRLDHSYGNLLLLTKVARAGGHLEIHTQQQRIQLLPAGCHQLSGHQRYSYVSFFAWLAPVNDLTLEGFAYPLRDYRLLPENPLCISNVWRGATATVSFREGQLLMVEANDTTAKQRQPDAGQSVHSIEEMR